MKIRLVAASFAALTLVLAGCGNSEEDQASEAIAQNMLENSKEDDEVFQVSEDEANCVGDGFVDGIGVEKLKEYGVLTEDLEADTEFGEDMKMSKDDAESAADTMLDCLDLKEALTESMGDELDDQPEAKKCLEDAFTDDTLKTFLVAMFSGDETAAQEALTGDLMECVMSSIGEDTGTE